MADIKWARVQVVLTGVPIEYMGCNSEAFADGDEVIIEFTDQSWDQPKVIGFKEEPQICNSVYVFPGYRQVIDLVSGPNVVEEKSLTMRLDYNGESWQWKDSFPRSYQFEDSVSRVDYAATGENGIGFTLGGKSISDYFDRELYFNHLDLFDSTTEVFSLGSGLPESKSSLCFESLKNGQCISQGGRDFTSIYSTTHRYLISGDAWEVLIAGSIVYDHASFVIDESMYIVGGSISQGHGKKSNSGTELYDNNLDVWLIKPTCPQDNWLRVNGYNLGGGGLVGGGGMIYDPENISGLIDTVNETYFYDADSESWTQKANGYNTFGEQGTATAKNETVALQFSNSGSLTHWFDYNLSTDLWRDRGVFGLTVYDDPIWYSHRIGAAGAEL